MLHHFFNCLSKSQAILKKYDVGMTSEVFCEINFIKEATKTLHFEPLLNDELLSLMKTLRTKTAPRTTVSIVTSCGIYSPRSIILSSDHDKLLIAPGLIKVVLG